MKKRFIFLMIILMALLAAVLLKRCVKSGAFPSKPEKAASISPAEIIHQNNLKKAMGGDTGPEIKDYDMLVAKTDAAGNTQWVRNLGGPDYDWADFAIECDDGGFLVLGRTYYTEEGEDDYYVIRLDSSGNTLWAKNFAGKNGTAGDSVAQAVDSGFIIAGKTSSGEDDGKEVYLAKTDRDGNYEWVHNFGKEYYEWGYSAVIAEDGSYIMVGQDETPGMEADVYLRKRGNSGKYEWAKSYGGEDYDWGYSITSAAGGYVLAGLTYSYGEGNDDVYLIKVDEDGGKVWDWTFGGTGYDEAFSVCGGGKEAFTAAGATSSWGSGGYDVFMIKIDADGNSLWSSVFGGKGNDAAYSINPTKDGGYIIAGATNSAWRKTVSGLKF